MAKFLITSTVVFEVDAEDSQAAAHLAFNEIEFHHPTPGRIDVWHQDGNHQFADRYTYDGVHLIDIKGPGKASVEVDGVKQYLDGTPVPPPKVSAKAASLVGTELEGSDA